MSLAIRLGHPAWIYQPAPVINTAIRLLNEQDREAARQHGG